MAIQGWVNAEREHVLVVRSHHARTNVGTPLNSLAIGVIKWHCRKDSGCAHFQFNVGGLIEDVGEDVLVVSDGADHLQDKLAVADHGSSAGSVVGVLVLQAIVLLVHANDVLQQDRVSLAVSPVAVEVLDMTQAVATQR